MKRQRSLQIAPAVLTLLLFCAAAARAQRESGELRLQAQDQGGAPLMAAAELASDAKNVRRTFRTDADGRATVRDLPLGTYRLMVSHEGFAPSAQLVEIRSEVPLNVSVTLKLASVETQLQVTEYATLIDPSRADTVETVDAQAIQEEIPAQPGRGLLEIVNSLPGWLFEANGTLHPRGSEYQVQFIVDGLPLTENRSPAFSAPFEAPSGAEGSGSVRARTAGYPAEYGRKLGGVVEIATPKDAPDGLHGQASIGGGSFASESGAIDLSYAPGYHGRTRTENRFSLSASGFHSERYLDPPVLANFTNRGTSGSFALSYERDFSERHRLRISVTHDRVSFLVPNELLQELAGQRQSRRNEETAGAAHYEWTISPSLLLNVQGTVRETSAQLASNALSTPIIVAQQRGFREGYVRADVSGQHGRNNWKAGADTAVRRVHEALQYVISDPAQFDPDVQPQFSFFDRQWDREQSAFIQDQIRFGAWNASAGIRFDHYSFLVRQSAWSPRLSVSRFFAAAGLIVHASYDRAFQTPAIENLLLASSPQLDTVVPGTLRVPVRGSHGNFYEVGFTKGIAGKLRIDANWFRRDFHDFADDDLLLNTGVSFPISFARARVQGQEARVELPRWGRFSGYVSYTNQLAIAQGPVTGGLFLGQESASALSDTSRFAVSQDQRNTLRLRVRFQAARRLWSALGAEYGSGLPVELGNDAVDTDFLLTQYGAAIMSRVNFDRQRVRPSFSLDVGAGYDIYRRDLRSVSFGVQANNLTDRLNVINFASLFSGTAVAAPRSVSARVRASF